LYSIYRALQSAISQSLDIYGTLHFTQFIYNFPQLSFILKQLLLLFKLLLSVAWRKCSK